MGLKAHQSRLLYTNRRWKSSFDRMINTMYLAGNMWKSSGLAVQLNLKCSYFRKNKQPKVIVGLNLLLGQHSVLVFRRFLICMHTKRKPGFCAKKCMFSSPVVSES
jgi:hypothetical protein